MTWIDAVVVGIICLTIVLVAWAEIFRDKWEQQQLRQDKSSKIKKVEDDES